MAGQDLAQLSSKLRVEEVLLVVGQAPRGQDGELAAADDAPVLVGPSRGT